MWRILGWVFFENKDYFIDLNRKVFHEQKIRNFLNEKGIAIYDTAYRVKRLHANASDKSLQIIEYIDLESTLMKIPHCHTLITTGELATQTLLQIVSGALPRTLKIGDVLPLQIWGRNLKLCRLPSTSRAYPLALAKKAAFYAALRDELN